MLGADQLCVQICSHESIKRIQKEAMMDKLEEILKNRLKLSVFNFLA